MDHIDERPWDTQNSRRRQLYGTDYDLASINSPECFYNSPIPMFLEHLGRHLVHQDIFHGIPSM